MDNERCAMKKFILAALIVGMGGAGVQTANAGGWSLAGKVLTGVVAASVVSHALSPYPYYYPAYPAYGVYPAYGAYPAYGYPYAYGYARPVAPAPAYYAPAPVVYARPPAVYIRPPVVYRNPYVVVRPPAIGVGVGVGPVYVGAGIR
jgi:hypothetical protein